MDNSATTPTPTTKLRNLFLSEVDNQRGDVRSTLGKEGTAESSTDADPTVAAALETLHTMQDPLPPLPNTNALRAMLIVLAGLALVFTLVIWIMITNGAANSALIGTIAGEGGIFLVVAGIATHLARGFTKNVSDYNARAAEWVRLRSVERMLQALLRSGPIPPEVRADFFNGLAKMLDSDK